MFSKIARSYNRSDVFTTEELKEVISPYAEVIIDEGAIVCDWRNPLAKKFSKLPGIRTLHDFIFTTNGSSVEAKERKLWHTGQYEKSALHILRGMDISECVILHSIHCNYYSLGNTKQLTDSKLKHLQQMYHDFIPTDRRLSFL